MAIDGTSGNDSLDGTAGDDVINGLDGHDTINGLAGADTIDGGIGDDSLDGGDDNDLLIGGVGFDTLVGGLGDDTLQPQADGTLNGELFGLNGLLDGGAGVDRAIIYGDNPLFFFDVNNPSASFTMEVTPPGGSVGFYDYRLIDVEVVEFRNTGGGLSETFELALGGLGDDALTAALGLNFHAYAGDGADTLTGGANDDWLVAGAGADSLVGNAGDDFLDGGAGADTLAGGSGADFFYFDAFSDIDATGDVITDFGIGDTVSLGFSGLSFIGTAAFSGSAPEYRFTTGGGVTVIQFDENGDGAADRLITLSNGEFSLRTTFEIWPISPGQDLEIAVVAPATAGDDRIRGTIGDELLEGLAGNDSLEGTLGNDTLDGGAGDDLILGGEGADSLTGGDGADNIDGGVGDDTITGGAGIDTFDWDFVAEIGSTGDIITDFDYSDIFDFTTIDIFGQVGEPGGLDLTWIGTAAFSGAAGEYRFEKAAGQTQIQFDVDGDGTADRFVIIANGEFDLQGTNSGLVKRDLNTPSPLNDFITGTIGDDTIDGLAGNDTIDGNWGADSLLGGDGDDSLFGGNLGADTLMGGAGDDTLQGGSDADVIDGGAGVDALDYANSNAGVSVNLMTGAASGGHAAGDSWVNVENLFGSNHDDTLTGDDGANLLAGASGVDALSGGAGADTLDGGAGDDTASYADATAAVDIDLSAGAGFGDVAAGDLLISIERVIGSSFADTLRGSALNDTLLGADGDDSLRGFDGDDVLDGGKGDDIGFGGAGNDLLLGSLGNDLLAGQLGNDTVQGGGGDDKVHGNGGDDKVFGGSGNDKLTGSDGADTLNGGDGNDQVFGNAGGDKIIGGLGDDRLVGLDGDDAFFAGGGADTLKGGAGNDTLLGGGGADEFEFETGTGQDVITDFSTSSGDVIFLKGFGAAFDDFTDVQAAASQVGADTVIDLGGGSSVTLLNVNLGELSADDFLFG